MVGLRQPLREFLPFDAFTIDDGSESSSSGALWFAACSQSKAGFPVGAAECWTLVSTPNFAVQEIEETAMQDPVTGAFRPQENNYLNTIPGPKLFSAFMNAVKPSLEAAGQALPEAVYLQAQRWGSGLPAPHSVLEEDVRTVCGVRYATKVPSLVYPRPTSSVPTSDFLADDEEGLYYAGDFCSHRCPGFESAALSGLDVAHHMIERLLN
jgi:predicted NAD/FAD-dependent oxidoreductase